MVHRPWFVAGNFYERTSTVDTLSKRTFSRRFQWFSRVVLSRSRSFLNFVLVLASLFWFLNSALKVEQSWVWSGETGCPTPAAKLSHSVSRELEKLWNSNQNVFCGKRFCISTIATKWRMNTEQPRRTRTLTKHRSAAMPSFIICTRNSRKKWDT